MYLTCPCGFFLTIHSLSIVDTFNEYMLSVWTKDALVSPHLRQQTAFKHLNNGAPWAWWGWRKRYLRRLIFQSGLPLSDCNISGNLQGERVRIYIYFSNIFCMKKMMKAFHPNHFLCKRVWWIMGKLHSARETIYLSETKYYTAQYSHWEHACFNFHTWIPEWHYKDSVC